MGVEFFPSQANFFLINVRQNADAVFEALLKQGVIVPVHDRIRLSGVYPRQCRSSGGKRPFLKALGKVLG
jgi:histidinol-phosphate aminotransferase